MKLCFRHPSNIQDKTIPHSYADFKGSGNCEMKDDLISRQLAIELVDWYQHEFCECDYAFGELANELSKLPSAEPEIIRCKDCKFYDHFWNGDWCSLKNIEVKDANDFCSRAKRRTDE